MLISRPSDALLSGCDMFTAVSLWGSTRRVEVELGSGQAAGCCRSATKGPAVRAADVQGLQGTHRADKLYAGGTGFGPRVDRVNNDG